jgi:TatD DNase family protein
VSGSPVWFDTHCHLYDVEDEVDDVVDRARTAGARDILTLGVDVTTSRRCAQIAAAHDGLWAGAAYHPSETQGWHTSWIADIEAIADDPNVIAIGETGLDYHWDTSFVDSQQRGFAAHIGLAKRLGKTLVIHTRDSIQEALHMLDRAGAPERLVFHCWTGAPDQLVRALDLGAYISFAGNVSYKNAPEIREAAKLVPDDRLVVETDSPYLAPIPHRGKPNEPAYVAAVGEALAAARGQEIEVLATATTRNARALFGLDR